LQLAALGEVLGYRGTAAYRVLDMRPLLLLDVDGVLNPLGVREVPGFMEYRIAGLRVLLSLEHGRWLASLADQYDLTWATSWERDADLIAERIGLPLGMPAITFTNQSEWTVKLPDVLRYVGDRAVAWVDDQLGPDVQAWAESRPSPTLLVQVDGRVGMTAEDVELLRAWGAGIARR
jgi:hypothetical protein